MCMAFKLCRKLMRLHPSAPYISEWHIRSNDLFQTRFIVFWSISPPWAPYVERTIVAPPKVPYLRAWRANAIIGATLKLYNRQHEEVPENCTTNCFIWYVGFHLQAFSSANAHYCAFLQWVFLKKVSIAQIKTWKVFARLHKPYNFYCIG